MNEILLNPFNTPFQSFPFDQIENTDYEPAIIHLLEKSKEEIDHIANNPESPTFQNTIEKLEKNGNQLNRVTEAFYNIDSANTNDYIQEISQQIAPKLAAFSNDILLNEKLFKRVKEVYDNGKHDLNNSEQLRLLDKTYKRFVRNGALLSNDEKIKIREIDNELAQLRVKFSKNVLQETNSFYLNLHSEDDIFGIPNDVLTAAAEEARSRNLEGYVFTLQYPSYVPFMKYATNRKHRETMYEAYNRRGYNENEWNNEEIIRKIVNLKNNRAQILGYQHHADFVLEERMAKSPIKVTTFLNDLLQKAKPYAEREIQQIKSLATDDGIDHLMPYDHAFYAEKLREKLFYFSEEEIKPYFPLNQVLEAAFNLSSQLFNLRFEKTSEISKYHPEVDVYKVWENDQFIALLYTDFHPRDGKRPGAWMTSFKGQYIEDEINERPHISIVCNFSRPIENTPSLLTFQEVTTLFHEFGHALHGMLANTHYESLSGTNVYWDFVELPSQFLENFCYHRDFLSTFAKHWETGEILPLHLLNKIIASSNFMEGYQTLRQISFGLLDMAYYSNEWKDNVSLEEFEMQQTQSTQLYPKVSNTAFSPSFAHIFGGGYSAGYYSYKWAEVLDADAYEYFLEMGIFNKEAAGKFKQLLSSGGTVDPMELFVQFRGREPKVDALLTRAGLVTK